MSSTVPGDPGPTQDVKEVWFAGCHSDVGGGAVEDAVHDSLANIPLRWMVKEVMISKCGIKFDREALKKAGIPTLDDRMQPAAEQNRREELAPEPSDSPQDQADALADIHDQLKIKRSWWLLEPMPMKFSWQEFVDGAWEWKSDWEYALTNVAFDSTKFH